MRVEYLPIYTVGSLERTFGKITKQIVGKAALFTNKNKYQKTY